MKISAPQADTQALPLPGIPVDAPQSTPGSRRGYRRFTVGQWVRVGRDETRYPSKGTWPQFRGRIGVVVQTNLGEYGVSFSKTRHRPDGSLTGDKITTWFQPYELRAANE